MATYRAIKRFTYAGRGYAPGDAWEPAGHRNDARMITGRLVLAEAAEVAQAAQGLSPSQARAAAAEPAPRRKGRAAPVVQAEG